MCKNDDTEIVRAGEKLKDSKKKAKMASANSSSSRDWGKGFACAGRQKVCTIVPQNHFGPVPGVEVGTQWKFRLQVSHYWVWKKRTIVKKSYFVGFSYVTHSWEILRDD